MANGMIVGTQYGCPVTGCTWRVSVGDFGDLPITEPVEQVYKHLRDQHGKGGIRHMYVYTTARITACAWCGKEMSTGVVHNHPGALRYRPEWREASAKA